MLAGKTITVFDALSVTVSSMLVVFLVLLILFVSVKLFPLFFKEKNTVKTAPKEDDDEVLLAVIAAAISAYESGRVHPLIRNISESSPIIASCVAGNPEARDCRR